MVPRHLYLIDGQCLSGCPCHYSMPIEYHGGSVAIQVFHPLLADQLQAIPCFQLGRNTMHVGSPFALSRRSSAVGWGG